MKLIIILTVTEVVKDLNCLNLCLKQMRYHSNYCCMLDVEIWLSR